MPASVNYQPIKHRHKGKGFKVLNKCPYCKTIYLSIETTPLPKHITYWPQACPLCRYNRSKSAEGDGYAPRIKGK